MAKNSKKMNVYLGDYKTVVEELAWMTDKTASSIIRESIENYKKKLLRGKKK